MTTRRKTGIATVHCRTCKELNGVTLLAHHGITMRAMFRCHSCESCNIVTLHTDVMIPNGAGKRAVQKGVKVHG